MRNISNHHNPASIIFNCHYKLIEHNVFYNNQNYTSQILVQLIDTSLSVDSLKIKVVGIHDKSHILAYNVTLGMGWFPVETHWEFGLDLRYDRSLLVKCETSE